MMLRARNVTVFQKMQSGRSLMTKRFTDKRLCENTETEAVYFSAINFLFLLKIVKEKLEFLDVLCIQS